MNAVDGVNPEETLGAVQKRKHVVLIGLCCVGFFVFDVLAMTCLRYVFTQMIVWNIAAVQLTVIGAWATMFRGAFWVRLPWTLLLLVTSWCGFVWGITLMDVNPRTESLLGVFIFLVYAFVTTTVPLKLVAWCFRWHIVKETSGYRISNPKRYLRIRDIMVGTFVMAAAMGILRLVLPDKDLSFSRAFSETVLIQIELLIAITIFGAISLLVQLPCIWISLGVKPESLKLWIVAWVVYCFVFALVEIIVFISVFGSPQPGSESVFIGVIVGHQLGGAVMFSVFLALRRLGYRLERFLGTRWNPA